MQCEDDNNKDDKDENWTRTLFGWIDHILLQPQQSIESTQESFKFGQEKEEIQISNFEWWRHLTILYCHNINE